MPEAALSPGQPRPASVSQPAALAALPGHIGRIHFSTQARQNVAPEFLGPSGQDASGGASALLSILDEAISETRRESQGGQG